MPIKSVSAPANQKNSRKALVSSIEADLKEVNSEKLRAFFKDFAAHYKVKDINTDGYNEFEGTAGMEIYFFGVSDLPVGYEKGFDAADMEKLSALLKSWKPKIKGFEASMFAHAEGVFGLVVVGAE